MRMFDNGIEVLVIKYTLGTCFVAVFLVFGVKIIMLLSAVAKLKIASLLSGLQGSGLEWLYDGIKALYERGAVK